MDKAKWLTPYELAAWQINVHSRKGELRVELPALQRGIPSFGAFPSVACFSLDTFEVMEGRPLPINPSPTKSQTFIFSTANSAGTASRLAFSTSGGIKTKNLMLRYGLISIRDRK